MSGFPFFIYLFIYFLLRSFHVPSLVYFRPSLSMLATDNAKVKSPMQEILPLARPLGGKFRGRKREKRKRNFRIDPRQIKEVDIHTVSTFYRIIPRWFSDGEERWARGNGSACAWTANQRSRGESLSPWLVSGASAVFVGIWKLSDSVSSVPR